MSPEDVHPIAIVFSLGILLFLTASVVGWISILVRKMTGQKFLPITETRRLAPWGLIDILATIVLLLLIQLVAFVSGAALGIGSLTPVASLSAKVSMDLKLAAWVQTSQLLVMVAITLMIMIRCRVSAGRIGWSVRHLGYDVVLGLAAACLFIPPVLAIMATLVYWLGEEYNHPILEMVGDDLSMLGFATWMAVFVAPITEEFGFRVLLQGYLESMAAGPRSGQEILLGRPDSEMWVAPFELTQDSESVPMSPTLQAEILPAFDTPIATDLPIRSSNPYAAPAWNLNGSDPQHPVVSSESKLDVPPTAQRAGQLAWWPVVVSGILFGLAHFEYGPSWIPLIILGFVLGWLYRMTNRLWPCLVVHVIINSFAMAGLASEILSGGTPITN